MSEKEMFLHNLEREREITLKVIDSYPSDRMDYKPHEKSSSARQLMWTFVMEEYVTGMVHKGEIDFGGKWPPAPESKADLVKAYNEVHREMIEKVKSMTEEDYNSKIKFFVAKGTMGEVRKADVLWFMLSDQIHHRGQLSVYIRLANGKVPSIYGPSADDPWM